MSMLVIGAVLALAIVVFLLFSRHSSSSDTKNGNEARAALREAARSAAAVADTVSDIRNHLENEIEWLREKWIKREQSKSAGVPQDPPWWWDEPSQAQLNRLKEGIGALRAQGMDFSFAPLTKGAASDLIGIEIEVDGDDKEVLAFFKVKPEPSNQTRARYAIRDLFEDPEKRHEWQNRPATREQLAVLKVLGVNAPKGITAPDALKLRNETERKLIDAGDPRALEAEAFESLIDIFTDKDECKDRFLKKPSWALLQEALNKLRLSGLSYQQMDADVELVEKKLLEMNPSLEREE